MNETTDHESYKTAYENCTKIVVDTYGDVADLQRKAIETNGDFSSNHEFYGVLAEEVHELLEALHANDDEALQKEALDVAAVCVRFVIQRRLAR